MNARTFGRKGSGGGADERGDGEANASRRAAFLAAEHARADRTADTEVFAPPPAAEAVEAVEAPAPVFVPDPVLRERSLTAAYAIWMVFGMVGGHRFYLARPITGGAQAALFGAGLAGVGAEYYPSFLAMAAAVLWMVADGFLIERMHRKATGGVFAQ